MIGKLFGNVELTEEIGKGATAIVYKGKKRFLEEMVAVKVFNEGQEPTPSSVKFQGLKHPNIVKFEDFNEEKSVFYAVMELMSGETIKQILDEQEKFNPVQAVDIIIDVLKALDYTHEQGILHRDVKPSNIFLTKKVAKLGDFGLARIDEDFEHSKLTRLEIAGTFDYMAPESKRKGDYFRMSDIYGVGVTLHEMLTGELLTSGVHASNNIKLNRLVTNATRQKLDQRISSAKEFLKGLQEVKLELTGKKVFVEEPVKPSVEKPVKKGKATKQEIEGIQTIKQVADDYLAIEANPEHLKTLEYIDNAHKGFLASLLRDAQRERDPTAKDNAFARAMNQVKSALGYFVGKLDYANRPVGDSTVGETFNTVTEKYEILASKGASIIDDIINRPDDNVSVESKLEFDTKLLKFKGKYRRLSKEEISERLNKILGKKSSKIESLINDYILVNSDIEHVRKIPEDVIDEGAKSKFLYKLSLIKNIPDAEQRYLDLIKLYEEINSKICYSMGSEVKRMKLVNFSDEFLMLASRLDVCKFLGERVIYSINL